MAAQNSEELFTLHDLTPGVTFKLSDASTITWIYLGEAYGNALMLREYLLGTTYKMWDTTTTNADYDGSNVDTYLIGSFYDAQSAATKSILSDSAISVITYDGSASAQKTLNRKVFILNATEANTTFIDALKAFYNTSSVNNARVAKPSGGSASTWWLRDAYTSNTNRMRVVQTSGDITYAQGTGKNYVRPVISLLTTTKVALVDGLYVARP